MNFVLMVLCTAAALGGARADSWRWPEGAASVRIDTKVRFTDDAPRSEHKNNRGEVQADEPQFEEPSNTEGFYNRPPGAGRYPVRVQAYQPYRVDEQGIYSLKKTPQHYSDGTLDSLQYCKCVSTPECNPSVDSAKACGLGKFLCCYKRPNKSTPQNTEFFNEVEDERPMLLPGQGERAGPFPPPPDTVLNGVFGPGHGHEAALLGILQDNRGPHQAVLIGPEGPTGQIGPKRPVLVGPGGPTGIIGPDQNRGVLVGPDGPTGVIGPNQQNRDVLVGPGGPTGVIGPGQQNRGVLVGPGGPTGVIGPGIVNKQEYEYFNSGKHDARQDETAQRGILVGPGGPTGIIGPAGFGRRPVLVGPGGPTGIIGPYGGRSGGRPVLVGPGGPTGMIGPPRRYYGK
ncbi:collagen alpha-2(I) chain-like isoform X1 [Ostrinia furnacalis]|uniref:collagen alpha-2(I) chain-like isoform X1 n=1 Tax=Ostrinia furnacalis TaxID=93504 RepID=UPI00103F3C51|nr:collagen alpha-2(I) chain-like isoform X1 [Ostrinia furnacalis]